jgi:hypothetical protein
MENEKSKMMMPPLREESLSLAIKAIEFGLNLIKQHSCSRKFYESDTGIDPPMKQNEEDENGKI